MKNNNPNNNVSAFSKAERQDPPRILWRQIQKGHQPIVFIGNVVMPLAPRPFKGYFEKEREAILVAIKGALSEILFGTPVYLVHPETGASAKNPDWDLLPYWVVGENDTLVEVKPTPSQTQEEAGNRLQVLPENPSDN